MVGVVGPSRWGEKCCACSKEFSAGDVIITFYFEHVLKGEKSGALGFYAHKNSPEESTDHVHFNYSCLEKCFSPIDNPFMYDTLVDSVRKEVYEDMADEDDEPVVTDNDDPPVCLWCKREDAVWVQYQRDMHIYNCLTCRKLWDDEENELIFDPYRGYVKVE